MISGSGEGLATGEQLFLDTGVGVGAETGAGIGVVGTGGVPETEYNGRGDRLDIVGGFQDCTQN